MARGRFYRPGLEGLESRAMMAFNVMISTAPTANIASGTTNGTTTFLPTGSGANVDIAEIASALAAGNNVLIDSGPIGTQNGTIFTSGITSFNLNNAAGTRLTVRSGNGLNSANADITLTGLQLTKQGTLIVDAKQNVNLFGELSAGTMTITAETGSISMPSGGELNATLLSLTAGGDIGTSTERVLTNVNHLTTDTSANNTDQFITEAGGLSAVDIDAGSGALGLILTAGGVFDSDTAIDMTADLAAVFLFDASAQDFGTSSDPIETSVDDLSVQTPSGGSQFIHELNGLTDLFLEAGSGNVTLTVAAGSVARQIGNFDLRADSATVTLNDPTAQNFGTSANPIRTDVGSLSVTTSAGDGNQFIRELNVLSGLNLDAGTGDVTLIVSLGAVSDDDNGTDITADAATVSLDDGTARNFGAALDLIKTSVNTLQVSTSAGDGDQFILENNGLTGLQLLADQGDVTLTVALGGITDTDAGGDISADAAHIKFNDTISRAFGAAANSIRTSVNSLSVDMTAGGGNQFITEDDGLTALDLDTFALSNQTGEVTLTLTAGGIADADAATDIRSNDVTVVLSATTAQNFGTEINRIHTSVGGDLSINTAAGGGSQFIEEPNRLVSLDLNAGAGDVTLVLNAGVFEDNDANTDITANSASVTLLDPTARDFGSAGNPIGTNTNTLSVVTSGGGNQFISEVNDTLFTGNAGAGDITLAGGTFNLDATNAISDLSTLVVNSPAIVNLASSNETIGGLGGSGTVSYQADGVVQTLFVGGNNQNTTFSGNLTGNDLAPGVAVDVFQKLGTGTLTISGNLGFTGQPQVNSGKLVIDGSLAASSVAVLVLSNGTLGGTGTLNRNVLVNGASARMSPGNSVGTLRMNNLTLNAGATFEVEVTSGAAGGVDQAATANGVLNLGNASGLPVLTTKAFGNVDLEAGNALVLIDNSGTTSSIAGTFDNLPEGANLGSNFLGSGLTANITYRGVSGSDNDVVIKLSPGSLFPWHNEAKPLDVSGAQTVDPDGQVVAGDALQVINYLNGLGAGAVPANAVLGLPFGFLDTDGDNFVTAADALDVINLLNAGLGGEGEGEAPRGYPGFGVQGSGGVDRSQETGDRSQGVGGREELLALLAMDVAGMVGKRRR